MPTSLNYTLLDVFTDQPLTGNQLAVFHDADGLNQTTMLAVARETRLSETTFVQSSESAEADYRNRIFTVAGEIPFAGHPSLGTAVAVAARSNYLDRTFVQQTGAGLQQIQVASEEGKTYASMVQPAAELLLEVPGDRAAAAISVDPKDLVAELPCQLITTGFPTLIVPVATAAVLATVKLDLSKLSAVWNQLFNIYVVLIDEVGATVQARCFSPVIEGFEDPATGSAAGPLVHYLKQTFGQARAQIVQGVRMNRPSVIDAWIDTDQQINVGGNVVIVGNGVLLL